MRIQAKDLVRTRTQVKKMIQMRSQLQTVSMTIQVRPPCNDHEVAWGNTLSARLCGASFAPRVSDTMRLVWVPSLAQNMKSTNTMANSLKNVTKVCSGNLTTAAMFDLLVELL